MLLPHGTFSRSAYAATVPGENAGAKRVIVRRTESTSIIAIFRNGNQFANYPTFTPAVGEGDAAIGAVGDISCVSWLTAVDNHSRDNGLSVLVPFRPGTDRHYTT
jgi:hypothetical protein